MTVWSVDREAHLPGSETGPRGVKSDWFASLVRRVGDVPVYMELQFDSFVIDDKAGADKVVAAVLDGLNRAEPLQRA